MQNFAKYLFRINEIPHDVKIKDFPIELSKRNDWFARNQSPRQLPKLNIELTNSKKILFLDMDETIIARSGNWFYNSKSHDFVIGTEKIVIRPYLSNFLHQVEKKYNVILFTASGPKRLSKILSCIPYTFHSVLHREFTSPGRDTFIHRFKSPVFKDLNRFNINLTRALILDDNPNYFLSCQENGIKIKPYFGGTDDALLRYSDLLSKLSESKNMQYSISHLKTDYPFVFEGTRWLF
eukprot:NODE_831_length_3850_cov_0.209544.p3 type:complete len:237 gc:universal NODE_831_length_3850_cov_0.209544:2413-1703(-)